MLGEAKGKRGMEGDKRRSEKPRSMLVDLSLHEMPMTLRQTSSHGKTDWPD